VTAQYPAPSAEDGVVRAAAEVVGGPLGAHAAPRPPSAFPAAPLLVLAGTAVLALATLGRSHCRRTDWASPGQLTHACYSDVASRVASGTVADQPPGAALLSQLLSAVTPSTRGAFDLSVLLCAAALALAVLSVVLLRATRGRPWDAAALALSPVLLVSGLVSLELVAVAGVAVGLLGWARGRLAVAGAALAVAATVDPLALAVLGATCLVGLVARRAAAAVTAAAAASAALLAVAAAWWATGLAGQALASGDPAPERGVLSAARAVAAVWVPGWSGQPGYGSLWLLPALPTGTGAAPPGWLVLTGAAVGTAITGLAVVLLARRWARRHGPEELLARTPALALVAACGALVVAPTVPVQSALLLLPLVAATGLLWREHLPWAVVEALAATTTWLYIYGQQVPSRGAEPWAYGLMLTLRLAAVAWLSVTGVRRCEGRRAEPDLDPSGPVDDGRAGAPSPVVLPAAR